MKFFLKLSFILHVSSTGDYGLYPGGQADYNKDDNAIGRPFGLLNNNNNNNQDYNNDEDDDENGNDDDQEDDVEEDNNQETEDEDKDNEDDGGNDEDKDDDEDNNNNNNFGGDYSGSFQPRGLNNEASSNLMRKFAKFNPQRTSYGGCTSLLL